MQLQKRLPSLLAFAWAIATPAFAADQALPPLLAPLPVKAQPVREVDYFAPRPIPSWQIEFAARYWFASAKTGKSLYGPPGELNSMVSRLTYSDMLTSSGELYGRAAFSNGWFIKGYAGVGVATGGNLQDEDFPPGIVPYSSTNSAQHGGHLAYASGDLGYDVVRGGDFRVGLFAGYHYFDQEMDAYGCTQTAGNPDVCQPVIPTQFEIISQSNVWQAARLGLDGSVQLGERFKLSAEGAWLPYVWLDGADTHWLRIGGAAGDFNGPVPETGHGQGYQFEALLSYQLTEHASIGIGARYWHMEANGEAHFENHVVDENSMPQPVSWKTDIYGVFLQGSYKFGSYPLGVLN